MVKINVCCVQDSDNLTTNKSDYLIGLVTDKLANWPSADQTRLANLMSSMK